MELIDVKIKQTVLVQQEEKQDDGGSFLKNIDAGADGDFMSAAMDKAQKMRDRDEKKQDLENKKSLLQKEKDERKNKKHE